MIDSMSEYELLFWGLIAFMAFVALVLWVIQTLVDNEKPTPLQKRLAQVNREADKLLQQARSEHTRRKQITDRRGRK